jgi:hypothetical protein
MAANPCVQCRVTQQTKDRLRAIAQERQITESALLKRVLENALLPALGMTAETVPQPVEQVARGARLYVRLRPEDHLLLRERANGRGMAAGTYASFLLRAHLRAVTPMPDRELAELKRSVAALGAIGRNLNQIARAANQARSTVPGVADLLQTLRACEALRVHVKGLINANRDSWEMSHEEAHR